MIKVFEIKNTDMSLDVRFEPAYYYFSKIVKEKSIANGTKYKKLKGFCQLISDGEHSAIPRLKSPGVRYLYGRNIKDGIVNFDPITDSSYISESNYLKFTRIHLKENDILLTIVGTIGKTALYKEEYIGKAGIPRHIAKIRLTDDSEVSPEYIIAFFLSKLGKWQLNNITTGNIQPLLSIGNIEKLDIPIISKEIHDDITIKEQKIIECETKANTLIYQSQNVFNSKLGYDFKSINRENVFTINKSDLEKANLWTPMYSLPLYVRTLNIIKEKWETVTIGKIADIAKGDEVGSDNYIDYLDKGENDVPFVKTSDIVNYDIDKYPDFFIPEDIYIDLEQGIKSGDVLFTNDGKIGQVAIVTESDKFILQSHIKRLRINDYAEELGITPEYLFTALSIKEVGLYQAKRNTVIQSTIPTLANNLAQIEIPILDKDSIKEITDLTKEAFRLKDEKKKLMVQVREELDNYFKI